MPNQLAVARFGREEFVNDRWAYRSGEHVTFLGTTGSGKTTLAYQLMARSATPRRPAVILVMKPKDETVTRLTKDNGYTRVRSWPPAPTPWRPRHPPGWVLWPRHRFDPKIDDPHLAAEFEKGILDSYKRGNRIIFADEVYGISKELKLDTELIAVWTRGRSMGTGLWAASQRPSQIPLWAYSQAEHIFLWNDPDRRARIRYGEIGGVDPYLVQDTVMSLGEHEALYIRRRGRAMCVIEA